MHDLYSKLLVLRRLDCARYTMYFLCVLVCLLGVQVIGEVLGTSMLAVDRAFAPRMAIMVVVSLPALFPRILSWESSGFVLYVVLMAVLSTMAATESGEDFRVRLSDALSTAALISSGLCPRFRVVLIPNICFTGCGIAASISANLDSDELVRTVSGEVGLLLTRLTLCYWGEFVLELLTRKEAEASFGICQQSAVTALLGMTFDAVVELNDDFCFTSDFPKLKGLLRQTSCKSLQGQSLSTFAFDEEERARLRTVLKSSTPAANDSEDALVQGMISFCLRDSIGNRIATTLMDVPYISAGRQVRHLIGLREAADMAGPVDGPGHASAPRQPESNLRPEVVERLSKSRAPAFDGFFQRPRSSKSGGSSRSDYEEPSVARTTELLLCSKLPALWVAEEVRRELDLEPPSSGPNGGCLPEFGGRFPDGGRLLLTEIKGRIEQEEKKGTEGHFVVDLGNWELFTSSGFKQHKLWLSYFLPLRHADDIPFVGLSVCRPNLRPAGHRPLELPCTGTIGKPQALGQKVQAL